MNRPSENIVLIGFMGSGKSSIGRLAASMLHFDFVDTDQLVVARAGMEVTEIFEKFGQEHFRKLETEALTTLVGHPGLVIATGGGVPTRPENVPVLKSLGVVIWLTASEETLFDRVSRNKKRPLLQTDNPRQTLHELLSERNPIYESIADAKVDSTNLRHLDAAIRIVEEARKR